MQGPRRSVTRPLNWMPRTPSANNSSLSNLMKTGSSTPPLPRPQTSPECARLAGQPRSPCASSAATFTATRTCLRIASRTGTSYSRIDTPWTRERWISLPSRITRERNACTTTSTSGGRRARSRPCSIGRADSPRFSATSARSHSREGTATSSRPAGTCSPFRSRTKNSPVTRVGPSDCIQPC